MKVLLSVFVIEILLIGISKDTLAQNSVFDDAKEAIGIGSAKELVNFLNAITEIKIDGKSSNYSKGQAEYVLRDFFNEFPPKRFSYIHEGSSKEGLHYAIGKYEYQGGTHRVYILFKKIGDEYLIDTIDLTKE